MKYLLLILILIIGCNNAEKKSNNKDENTPDIITEMFNPKELEISNTFPDTLRSGDTLTANISVSNKKWQITRAFSYCPIGDDGVFRVFHRTAHECREFLVENNKVHISFVTVGQGEKLFDLVTLILVNELGQLKATELQLEYYLKE